MSKNDQNLIKIVEFYKKSIKLMIKIIVLKKAVFKHASKTGPSANPTKTGFLTFF